MLFFPFQAILYNINRQMSMEVILLEERQIQLFDVVEYGGKKTRGHYNKKPKEVQKLNPYLELSQVRVRLANYLPVPLMADIQECTTFGHFNLWYLHYTNEEYQYEGEIYRGEEFKIIEAELIGTERFNIDTRLYLHKKLFELINTGVTIHEAAEKLQEEIKKLRLENGENNTVDGN